VLSSTNIDDISNIINLAQKLRAAHFRLIPFVPKGRGGHYTDLEVPPKKVEKITRYLNKLRNEIAINIANLEFEEMIDGNACSEHLDLRQPLGCSGAVSYATITPTGELLPCHFFEGVRADSVANASFSEVWRRSRFLNYFRHLNVGDLNGVCHNCSWLTKCGGSCRATNFAKGDLFGPNLSCWIAEELKGDLNDDR
jgi:radical SAM protein with 4Fe4S-binding SPASM domain